MISVLEMMAAPPRSDPDWTGALEAYVAAAQARDKAAVAFDNAEAALLRREAEMRAVYERLTGEGEGGG